MFKSTNSNTSNSTQNSGDRTEPDKSNVNLQPFEVTNTLYPDKNALAGKRAMAENRPPHKRKERKSHTHPKALTRLASCFKNENKYLKETVCICTQTTQAGELEK